MNEHSLSGMCAYIVDFIEWYLKAKFPPDVMKFVKDRFSQCSQEKKEKLVKVFNELSTKISPDGTLTSDTDDIAIKLFNTL